MNVRLDVLYWIDECLLNKRPTMMCLAGEKNRRRNRRKKAVSMLSHLLAIVSQAIQRSLIASDDAGNAIRTKVTRWPQWTTHAGSPRSFPRPTATTLRYLGGKLIVWLTWMHTAV